MGSQADEHRACRELFSSTGHGFCSIRVFHLDNATPAYLHGKTSKKQLRSNAAIFQRVLFLFVDGDGSP